MRKYLICVLSFIVCILLCILVAFISEKNIEKPQDDHQASENKENTPEVTIEAIFDKAKTCIEDSYEEVYFLRNISTDLESMEFSRTKIKFTVATHCEYKLKYSNVYEMPFVKGMQNEIKDRELEDYQQKAIDDYIREIEEDANFGNYSELNVYIVIVVNEANTKKPWKIYYSDGVNSKRHDIELLRPNPDELFKQGEEAAKTVIKWAAA